MTQTAVPPKHRRSTTTGGTTRRRFTVKRLLMLTIIAPGPVRHPVPVLLDAADRAVQRQVAAQPTRRRCCPADFTLGALQAGAGLEHGRAGPGRGRLRRRHQLLAVPAELGHRRRRHHRRPGVLLRDGRLRLRPHALARPGQDLRPVPRRADGPADLHHAAELPADQAARPAEHPVRASSCRSCS